VLSNSQNKENNDLLGMELKIDKGFHTLEKRLIEHTTNDCYPCTCAARYSCARSERGTNSNYAYSRYKIADLEKPLPTTDQHTILTLPHQGSYSSERELSPTGGSWTGEDKIWGVHPSLSTHLFSGHNWPLDLLIQFDQR
jgi:hypothetical protein